MISLSFKHWPHEVGEREQVFAKLIELAINQKVQIVDGKYKRPTIQIESVYSRKPLPSLKARTYRFLASHTSRGINFSKSGYSTNQQPSGNSKYNIFWTGENERPPYGDWDCYLSFDVDDFGGKNAYLPLWWLTSSDLIMPTVSPYLGRAITIDEMLFPRKVSYDQRKKFCVAFIGKAYPFRMQAIAALSRYGKVDVFGGIARNANSKKALQKYSTSQEYKFVFAFENDLYPGYVTEKVFEAWATGAIPLYWGMDVAKFLNPKSILNLVDFKNLEQFALEVQNISQSREKWEQIAQQPLLLKRPNLDNVLLLLRKALRPLVVR